MNYRILKAEITDAEEILKLQKSAYQIEAKRYNNYDILPLKQTLEELKSQFKNHIILKAVSDEKIIGTVRAYGKDGTCYIGRLAVSLDMHNQGIGTALMKEIEKYFTPKRYELFVGSKSDKNIYLYQKLGYNIFETNQYECGNIEIFYMEKFSNPRTKMTNKQQNKTPILNHIFVVITVSISIASFIITILSKNKFLELYKELQNFDFPFITGFLLSPLGNLSLSAFFICAAVFTIIKEFYIHKKNIALIVNIVTLIIILLLFFIYTSGIILPLTDFKV